MVLDKIEIRVVSAKDQISDENEGESPNPKIIITYDKFAKKVSEKYMKFGKWSIILDLNLTILGKYANDFLYSARKMFQNTSKIAQFCVFSDSASVFEKVENLNEMRKIIEKAGRPVVIMEAGSDPSFS